MTKHLWELPASWEWSVVGELGDVVSGGTPSTTVPEYWGGDVNWFAPSDLTGHKQKYIARGAKNLTRKGLAKSSAKLLAAGSVMFSSRAPVGYVAINSAPAATNQGFKSITPHGELFNEYLYYYLKGAKRIAEERASGTTFKELSLSAFSALPVPIPPSNEQHRIVDRIEALFKEIDRESRVFRLQKRRSNSIDSRFSSPPLKVASLLSGGRRTPTSWGAPMPSSPGFAKNVKDVMNRLSMIGRGFVPNGATTKNKVRCLRSRGSQRLRPRNHSSKSCRSPRFQMTGAQ